MAGPEAAQTPRANSLEKCVSLLSRLLHLNGNGFGLGCGADEGVEELEALGREAVLQLLDMVQDRLVALSFEGRELLRDCRRQGVRSRRLGAPGLDQGRGLGVEACDRGFGIGLAAV
jgi:hypothetical protein